MKRRRFLQMSLAGGAAYLTRRLPAVEAQTSRVPDLLAAMSLRQKVGQLFIFSVEGRAFTDSMWRLVRDNHAGGLALFAYNVDTPAALTQLTNDVQSAAMQNTPAIPLFLAADQEGGRVQRLTRSPFSDFPSPMALGAADDVNLTAGVAGAVAEEMRACGLNMNLAPVLDTNSQPRNPVINTRAFSSDALRVGRHGLAFTLGLQTGGIVATGKHFPGHGSTTEDSHYTLPIVAADRASLDADLQPFREAIGGEIGAMMTAHIVYNALDSSTAATFSAPIMTHLLRDDMGFRGVLMTDALTMGAISASHAAPVNALGAALNAGVDMLVYGALPDGSAPTASSQLEAVELVLALVEYGQVPLARVDEAVTRILTLKERFGLLDWSALDVAATDSRLNLPAHAALLTQAAEASITLVRDDPGLLPLDPAAPLALIYPERLNAVFSPFSTLPDVVAIQTPLAPTRADITAVTRAIGERVAVCLTWDTARYPEQVALVNALPLERTAFVAAGSPYDLLAYPLVKTYLTTYGASPATFTALRRILFGEIPLRGSLPIRLT